MNLPAPAILLQFSAFFGVGLVATAAHYSVLIGLVELAGVDPVRAALAGYLSGGLVSYVLNRSQTFRSDRPHREAGWRFLVVMAVGFCLTLALMALFVDIVSLPYLPSQIITTGVVMIWNFSAHKWWTFGEKPQAGV